MGCGGARGARTIFSRAAPPRLFFVFLLLHEKNTETYMKHALFTCVHPNAVLCCVAEEEYGQAFLHSLTKATRPPLAIPRTSPRTLLSSLLQTALHHKTPPSTLDSNAGPSLPTHHPLATHAWVDTRVRVGCEPPCRGAGRAGLVGVGQVMQILRGSLQQPSQCLQSPKKRVGVAAARTCSCVRPARAATQAHLGLLCLGCVRGGAAGGCPCLDLIGWQKAWTKTT